MPETKIPQKGGFTRAPERDFFADTEPNVPHKLAEVHQDVGREPIKEPLNAASKPMSGNGVVESENASEALLPLRTYRQDVAGVMRDQKTSLVRLVLEEQKERNKREREISPTSRKNLPLIFLSVIFLVSTVGIVYYAYFRLNPVDRTLENLNITPLIFIEKNKEIPIDGRTPQALREEVTKALQGTDIKVDAIEYLFFTETLSAETPDGIIRQKTLIPSNRFFETMEVKMPQGLFRSLRPDFMLGIHSFNRNQPFLILRTDYYDNAFAGMLDWEKTLVGDLLPLFGQTDRVYELSQRRWGDMVIKNKDTRVLRNFNGSIALVYAFRDQRTLIITTNEDTLLEVSRRLDLAKEKRPD